MEGATGFVASSTSVFVRGTAQPIVYPRCRRASYALQGRRRAPRMLADDAGGASEGEAEDEAPSDTYVPPSDDAGSAEERVALAARLLRLCAASARGQAATDAQRAAIDSTAASLEALSPEAEPVNSPFFDGVWSLAYSSAPLFRSSPLLLAAATPLLEVGAVRQRIDLAAGRVVSDVEVTAFPRTTATVRTTCRATPVGADRVELAVDKSTVVGGKLAGRLDLGGLSFDVPVQQIYERIRRAVPETYFDTYFLGDSLRISRAKNGTLYVYVKE